MGSGLRVPFWGTGIFESPPDLLFDFLFDELGLHRLEARAAVQNGRANGAARKIGAVPEGVARQAVHAGASYHDQLMWSTARGGLAPVEADDSQRPTRSVT